MDKETILIPDKHITHIADVLESAMNGSETNDFNREECEAMTMAIGILRRICHLHSETVCDNAAYEKYGELLQKNAINEFFHHVVYDPKISDVVHMKNVNRSNGCADFVRLRSDFYILLHPDRKTK